MRFRTCLLYLAIGAIFLVTSSSDLTAQTSRHKIAWCWQHGAVNTPAMQVCSGLFVDTPTFNSCMNYGPCFEEGPIQVAVASRVPFCGAVGFIFCPAPSPCGFSNTIACPFQCGARGFPPCAQPQPCGTSTTLPCQPNAAQLQQIRTGYGEFMPTLQFAVPQTTRPGGPGGGIRFAAPPLPDESQLRACIQESGNNSAEFYQCVVERALPDDYKIARQCLARNQNDGGRALLCSTRRQDLLSTYDRFRQVQACAKKGQDNWDVAGCVGQQVLGSNEQYYLSCVTRNRGDLKTAAVCAIAKDLTPEQQIALSCAISTGGQPHAFAVCTGGQLLSREIDKCWNNGIGTQKGCFGPNNEYVKFINNIDREARNLMGQNSEAYKAWKLWQDNVLTPGPNHEVIRFLNNGISDVRNGPGPNNEFVKFGNSVGGAVKSVGKIFGF